MQIKVSVPEHHTELIAELDRYAPRDRAGRLRLLAEIGLRASLSQEAEPGLTAAQENGPNEGALPQIKSRLLAGF